MRSRRFILIIGRSGYLRRAMESGAVGFLLKDARADQLTVAVRRIMAGERVVDPELAPSALRDGDNPLPRRERDVSKASLNGARIADIASRLYLSEDTVRNHIAIAIQKLNVHNRMEAAHRAWERGGYSKRVIIIFGFSLASWIFSNGVTYVPVIAA